MSQENIHANDAGSQMQLAADGRGVDVRQSPEADTCMCVMTVRPCVPTRWM